MTYDKPIEDAEFIAHQAKEQTVKLPPSFRPGGNAPGGKEPRKSQPPNITYSSYTSKSTSHNSSQHVVAPKVDGSVPLSQLMGECTSSDCAFRKFVVEHLSEAQVIAEDHMRQLGVSDAVGALYLLGLALVGGRDAALSDPANYCQVLLRLAFDTHFATTEAFPFTQKELATWPSADGWLKFLSGRLTRDSALHMLRSQTDLVDKATLLPDQAFTGIRFSFGKFERSEQIRSGDFYGNVTETHVTTTQAEQRVCVYLMTRSQYKELQDDVELFAGSILKRALADQGVKPDARVSKHKTPPGDIEIEGFLPLVEHTKADSRPWSVLGKRGSGSRTYGKSEPMAELFTELDQAVKRKLAYPASVRQSLVLLIDAGLLRLPDEALTAYKDSRRGFFQQSGFQQIWFVCGFNESATCLFRHD